MKLIELFRYLFKTIQYNSTICKQDFGFILFTIISLFLNKFIHFYSRFCFTLKNVRSGTKSRYRNGYFSGNHRLARVQQVTRDIKSTATPSVQLYANFKAELSTDINFTVPFWFFWWKEFARTSASALFLEVAKALVKKVKVININKIAFFIFLYVLIINNSSFF